MKRFFVGLFLLSAFVVLASARNAGKNTVSHRFFHPALTGTPYIIVNKSEFELQVYDDEGWYATYPVVLGSKSLDDKMIEGDRKTPEGIYHIASKRPHEKWDKMMLLDYPTRADMDKFNQRKAQGLIPRGARIGGGIGIHGTWPRDDMAVDYMQQWTNGCISLKNEMVDELYDMIPIGTKVVINH